MAIQAYIPDVKSGVKIAVALVIIFLILKYLPIPDAVRNLFRL